MVENDYLELEDENGDAIIGVEYIEGVNMLNYSWSIEDIEVLAPKENIKSKVLKFNPKRLFEGSKEDGHKHKRTSNGVGDKRRSKDKQPKRNTNKTVAKRSSK